MYPTQMRRHKIIRILLILFIVNQVVNFVFGAPVREKLEGCIDADGTAALQKRVNMEEVTRTSPDSGRTPATLPVRPYSHVLPYRPYSILTTNPRIPVRPYTPARPYTPVCPNNPVRPNSPGPIRILRLVRPVRPYFLLYRPPRPEGRLQLPSSLTTNNLNPEQPPPNQEPHSQPNPEQLPPNPGPHPSTSGEAPIDDVLDMLKNTKIKRTFPAAAVNSARMDLFIE
jgi:hypothetical protein